MLARARLSVALDRSGRSVTRQRRDAPPVAFRRCADTYYLVSTAASPVGADDVEIEIEVAPGATATVRSVGATIAYQSTAARQRYVALLGEGATLDWHLEPLVATARCSLVVETSLALAAGATLRWTEELVLGRHDEHPGRLQHRLVADYDGRPLLRHDLELGPGAAGWDGPAVLGDHRVAAFRLVAGAGADEAPACTAQDWALLPLEGPARLEIALGSDVGRVRASLLEAEPRAVAARAPAAR